MMPARHYLALDRCRGGCEETASPFAGHWPWDAASLNASHHYGRYTHMHVKQAKLTDWHCGKGSPVVELVAGEEARRQESA